jgi:hypothetical protein
MTRKKTATKPAGSKKPPRKPPRTSAPTPEPDPGPVFVPYTLDRYNLTCRPLPLPHTAEGEPSEEGWRRLAEIYGITRPDGPVSIPSVRAAGALTERVPNAGEVT